MYNLRAWLLYAAAGAACAAILTLLDMVPSWLI